MENNQLRQRHTHVDTYYPKKQQNSTFVGRVCDDFLNLPWDKIVAGLITGLIIYIGAARLFYLQDKVFETKLELGKLRLSLNDDINNLNSKIDFEYGRLNIELITLDGKLYKFIKSEINDLQDELEFDIEKNKDSIHNINIKLSILEIKNNQYTSDNIKDIKGIDN
tara:strand:+ start:694 stop:1191 length:498 start_codon:yes stop_codon:yes gene_type:complete